MGMGWWRRNHAAVVGQFEVIASAEYGGPDRGCRPRLENWQTDPLPGWRPLDE